MKFTVRENTPFKTLVSCVKMYHAVKHCSKSPGSYRLKGISLYLGECEAKTLDEEMIDLSEHKKICPFLGRSCEKNACALWANNNESCCLRFLAESASCIDETLANGSIDVAVYEGY